MNIIANLKSKFEKAVKKCAVSRLKLQIGKAKEKVCVWVCLCVYLYLLVLVVVVVKWLNSVDNLQWKCFEKCVCAFQAFRRSFS